MRKNRNRTDNDTTRRCEGLHEGLHEGLPQGLRGRLRADADRCVMCGLCLPHCPTYGATRNEADSPRGRVALIAALARGRLRADAALTTHLDQCLHCLRCQRACPAEVAYAGLIDGAKELLRSEGALAPPPLWLRWIVGCAALRRALALATKFWQRSGLQAALRRSGWWRKTKIGRMEAMLPRASARMRTPRRTPVQASCGGDARSVDLFTGCVAEIGDQETLEAARCLLHAAGFAVRVPKGRGCCGALDQHAGNPHNASRLMERNRAAFAGTAPIVSCATGCGAQWRRYGGDAAARHCDVLDFLAERGRTPAFAPLPEKAALHVPCTQRDAGGPTAATRLLARVPELALSALPDADGCCGAAGLHLLRQPDMGARLIADKIDALEAMNVKTLLTTNVGCALHFRRALGERGLDVTVMHPVSLLCRQLAGGAT